MSKSFDKGYDPGKMGPKKKHDTAGAFIDKEGNADMKKRTMPCGVDVDDTNEAEYAHRSNCDKCTTLW